ncbi:FKBP-type peptidyl-prolyl cis-trans isomerase [Halomonas cupida]|uniref:Peptidyl-prolyl cis-trans isomerase n=1 Tax=Halomonas cupida TaxID=44933 RepID=A0A1M7L0C6_9GAMM|nr:FKBP-type peptidyl-prolyl cis-trans isomerase [Halomonas cupida]GEN26325.1 outer membrane protein MIP [Halomonas cupida]SHM71318.1 FKBP-type peptidyl-prolyl cis-trans isomerase FklB [Halomonas cupida]
MKTLLTSASLIALLGAAPLAFSAPETDQAKLSYSLGVTLGQSIQQDVEDLDTEAFTDAVQDVFAGGELDMTDEQIAEVLTQFQQEAMAKRQEEEQQRMEEMQQQAEENKTAGDEYRAENAEKDGVTTTDSGLQYKEVEEGDGATPAAGDTVEVNYEGKLIDGTVFDSSWERGEPVSFQVGQVIDGWQEALKMMNVGDTWEVVIPPELAYGTYGQGPIGPNETLVFKVELLGVTPAEEAAAAEGETAEAAATESAAANDEAAEASEEEAAEASE